MLFSLLCTETQNIIYDDNYNNNLKKIILYDSKSNNQFITNKKDQYTKIYKSYMLSEIVDFCIGSYSSIINSNGTFILGMVILCLIVQIILTMPYYKYIIEFVNISNLPDDLASFIMPILPIFFAVIIFIPSFKLLLNLYSDKNNKKIDDKIILIYDNLNTSISKQMTYDKQILLLYDLKKLVYCIYQVKIFLIISLLVFILTILLKILMIKIKSDYFDMLLFNINILIHSFNSPPNDNNPDTLNIIDIFISGFIIMVIYLFIQNLISSAINFIPSSQYKISDNNISNIQMLFKNLHLFILTNNLKDVVNNIKNKSQNNNNNNNNNISTYNPSVIFTLILIAIFIFMIVFLSIINYILNRPEIINIIYPKSQKTEYKLHILQTSISMISFIIIFGIIVYIFSNYKHITKISYDINSMFGYIKMVQFNQTKRKRKILNPIKSIVIENLSIGYDAIPTIFCEFLMFKENELSVVLGPNGIGKSTILLILTGASPAHVKGNIKLIDNKHNQYMLNEVSSVSLLEHVSFMSPNNKLPTGKTLRELFQIHKENITDREIFSLLKKAQISNQFIKSENPSEETLQVTFSQEVKYDTLSGGQYHRLIIAVGLAKNASIQLFDEVFDSSDTKTANNIIREIIADKNKINIFITHHYNPEYYKKLFNVSEVVINYNGNVTTGKSELMS